MTLEQKVKQLKEQKREINNELNRLLGETINAGNVRVKSASYGKTLVSICGVYQPFSGYIPERTKYKAIVEAADLSVVINATKEAINNLKIALTVLEERREASEA